MAAVVVDLSSTLAELSPWGRDWARALKRRGHSPRTVHAYLRCALQFEAHLRQKGAIDGPESQWPSSDDMIRLDGWAVKKSHWSYGRLLEYLERFEARSPRTINSHFSPVTHYLKHVERNHGFPPLDTDRLWDEELRIFTKQIKKLRARRVNTPPTLDEMRRAIALEPNLRNRALLLLAAKTGARKSELLALDWDDLDLEAGVVRFKMDQQHFKRTTFVGLLDYETIIALRLCRAQARETARKGNHAVFVSATASGAGERLGRQAAFTVVTEAFARAGTKTHNVHSLRHWFSDTLRAHGMPDHMIAYLRGDAPASTLDLYTHLQSEAGLRQLRLAYDAAMPSLLS